VSDVRSVLELQVESILAALHAQQESRCREIEGASQRRDRQLLQSARERMRRRLHQAVDEERHHRADALVSARHRIETARRRSVLAGYRRFTKEAWPQLIDELERRWSDRDARRLWCEMAVREACANLPAQPWTVELPGSWPERDNTPLARVFAERGLPGPEIRIEQSLSSGLRIYCGDACLDATLDGLIDRRSEIEARLLAAWERQRADAEDAT
jgi:vacuolar-type H+-ATPase subunit H